jgi:hypothetical protein
LMLKRVYGFLGRHTDVTLFVREAIQSYCKISFFPSIVFESIPMM